MKKIKQTTNKANIKPTTIETSSDEISRLIKIIIGIIIIFTIFCCVTYFVTKDKKTENNFTDTPTEIQYSKVMIGTMLNLKEAEYYVIVTNEEDPDAPLYGTYLNLYKEKEKALPVYTSNLDDTLNSIYKDTQSNLNVTTLKGLKIKEATLFYIKDHKIVKTYEGKANIVKQFDQLIA